MEHGQAWALLSVQNATRPVLTLSTQPSPSPPCRPLSNSTSSWKLLYSLWVQTVSHSRAKVSLTHRPQDLARAGTWQVLQGVRGLAGRKEGAPRPKILGAAPSPESVSLPCSRLSLQPSVTPMCLLTTASWRADAALDLSDLQGSLEEAFQGQEGPWGSPAHTGKQVSPWHGGTEAPRHSPHCPFLVLSFSFSMWEIKFPESQSFGEPLKRQWGQRKGRWDPFPRWG